MTAMDETILRAPRQRAGRPAAGRHERRGRVVELAEPMRATRTTGGTRVTPARATRATRHAARAGWAERARRVAGQARAWWAEGTERVAARRDPVGGRAPTPAASVAPGAVAGPVRAAGRRRTTSGDPAPTAGRGHLPSAEVPAAPGRGHLPSAGVPAGPAPAAGWGHLASAGVPAGPAPGWGHLTPAPDRRTGATDPAPRHLSAVGRRASWGEDVVTGWCSLLLVLGLYLDGTAWLGVLYLGFAATAGWILTREQRRGGWAPRAVPGGYRVGLVGVGLAMVGVAGDVVWHALFGGEQGLARLVSPFHLVLLAGAVLLAGSALQAAWSGPSPAPVAGLKPFWPVLLSTTLVVAVAAWFLQDVSPLAGPPSAGTAPGGELAGLLIHNLLFVAPVLLLLLRWQTPLGTFTVMAGAVALLVATQTRPGLVGLAGAAVLGGTAADVAVALLRPSPQRRWAARAVAVIAPAVWWTAHFALLEVGYGAGRAPALWLGSVLWASLSGLTLALLMWPPAVPLTAWNRGRTRPRSTATPTAMPARMVGR